MDMTSLPAANIAFLSVLIALMVSEVVEKNMGSSSSGSHRHVYNDWRRISTHWSSFGLFGAISFYSKLAMGLPPSESQRGGARVTRARGHHKWDGSPFPSWTSAQAEELLSLIQPTSPVQEPTWLKPIFIVIGSSSETHPWPTTLMHFLWRVAVSLIIMTLPTIMLLPSLHNLSTLERATLCLQVASSIFGTVIFPMSLDKFNAPIVEPLSQIYHDRFHASTSKPMRLLQDGDLIISDPSRDIAPCVVWQTSSRSTSANNNPLELDGDVIPLRIRAIAGLNYLLVCSAFVGTYILVSHATKERQYLWLSAQVAIFALQFAVWTRKLEPRSAAERRLVYVVSGSLVHPPISHIPPCEPIPAEHHEKLDIAVIEFALASWESKCQARRSRRGSSASQPPHRPTPDDYDQLANNAPSDILSVGYVELGQYFNAKEKEKPNLSVLPLPWEFIEEMYRAQGVVLGHATEDGRAEVAGICIGAVFVENNFVGLTTVHRFQLHARHCQNDSSCMARHEELRHGWFTREGFVFNFGDGDSKFPKARASTVFWDTDRGRLGDHPVPVVRGNDHIRDRHDLFRANVALSRSTAKPNGPSSLRVEIHHDTPTYEPGLKPKHIGSTKKHVEVERINPSTDNMQPGEAIRASAYFAMTSDSMAADSCTASDGLEGDKGEC